MAAMRVDGGSWGEGSKGVGGEVGMWIGNRESGDDVGIFVGGRGRRG